MNVFDAIKSGRYENKVPYRINKSPYRISNDTVSIEKRKQNSEQGRLHSEEEYRLNALFRNDLEKEHGVSGHPKAGKLFEIAWARGHSSGYMEVANNYAELVELISP